MKPFIGMYLALGKNNIIVNLLCPTAWCLVLPLHCHSYTSSSGTYSNPYDTDKDTYNPANDPYDTNYRPSGYGRPSVVYNPKEAEENKDTRTDYGSGSSRNYGKFIKIWKI